MSLAVTIDLCVGKYEGLISGEAEQAVMKFLSAEKHTLAEYKAKIQHFRELSAEISGLDDVVLFDMFHLECHDIKHGLNEVVQNLTMALVKQLAEKHMDENIRIIGEYEHFRTRALKPPEDSREMMEQIAYMETVKTNLVRDQWEAVQASLKSLNYLLDVHTFTPEEMELNQTTLTWPEKLAPIFEENESLIEESKVQCMGGVHAFTCACTYCVCTDEGREGTD